MSNRIAIIQHGDYNDALRQVRVERRESYSGMANSVEVLEELLGGRSYLLISLNAPPYRQRRGLGELVGLPMPRLPRRVPHMLATILWARQFCRELSAFKPSQVLIRTGGILGIGILDYCTKRGIDTMVLLAESISDGGPIRQLVNRRLVKLLNHPSVAIVGNHRLPATELLIEHGVDPAKTFAYDWPGIPQPTDYHPKTLDTSSPAVILYAGTVMESKGIRDLLEAVAILQQRKRDVRLTALGSGPLLEEMRLRAAALQPGTADFVGQVSNTEVFCRMLAATLVCVPSRPEYPEGMPFVLTEALATRTPAVISNHPILRRAFQDGEGVRFFPPGNHVALADVIGEVLDKPEEYARLSHTTLDAFARMACTTMFGDLIRRWDASHRSATKTAGLVEASGATESSGASGASGVSGSDGGELVVVSPLRATCSRNGQLVLTRKFVDGLNEYAACWPGTVTVLVRLAQVPDNNLDHLEVDSHNVRFGVEVIPEKGANKMLARRLLRAQLVLAAVTRDREQMGLGSLCRSLGVPLVYISEYSLTTSKQMIETEVANPLRRLKRKATAHWIEYRYRRQIRMAAGIQCNGSPTFRDYHRINARPLLFFDTRVRADMLANTATLEQRTTELESGGPLRLAFSGRLIAIKGVHHLPRVAAELDRLNVPFTFDICGGGAMAEFMKAECRRLGVADRVRFRGVMDFHTALLPHITRNIDLFVCCHRQGDPSCTYLETMACGTPHRRLRQRGVPWPGRALGRGLDIPHGRPRSPGERHRGLARRPAGAGPRRFRLARIRQAKYF